MSYQEEYLRRLEKPIIKTIGALDKEVEEHFLKGESEKSSKMFILSMRYNNLFSYTAEIESDSNGFDIFRIACDANLNRVSGMPETGHSIEFWRQWSDGLPSIEDVIDWIKEAYTRLVLAKDIVLLAPKAN